LRQSKREKEIVKIKCCEIPKTKKWGESTSAVTVEYDEGTRSRNNDNSSKRGVKKEDLVLTTEFLKGEVLNISSSENL